MKKSDVTENHEPARSLKILRSRKIIANITIKTAKEAEIIFKNHCRSVIFHVS